MRGVDSDVKKALMMLEKKASKDCVKSLQDQIHKIPTLEQFKQ